MAGMQLSKASATGVTSRIAAGLLGDGTLQEPFPPNKAVLLDRYWTRAVCGTQESIRGYRSVFNRLHEVTLQDGIFLSEFSWHMEAEKLGGVSEQRYEGIYVNSSSDFGGCADFRSLLGSMNDSGDIYMTNKRVNWSLIAEHRDEPLWSALAPTPA